jgi:hypothetical protein
MNLHFFQRSDGGNYKSAGASADVPDRFPEIYSQSTLPVAADSSADQLLLAHALLSVAASG